MSVAGRSIILATAIALVGCGGEADQPAARNGTVTDIETLPADESAATTTRELRNGVNDPDVGNLGNQH